MRAVDVVQKKRDGFELTREEIDFFIRGYARGDVPDYQASAFTMAVFFKGMAPAEIVALTESMMADGRGARPLLPAGPEGGQALDGRGRETRRAWCSPPSPPPAGSTCR